MQRILQIILFSIVIILSSCDKQTSGGVGNVTPAPETTPQTTLMYMTGVNLLSYYSTNINMAKRAIEKNALGYGRLLVFTHNRANPTTASLVEYKYNKGKCESEILKEYTDINSLTQEAICEVLADVKSFAPADKYNLIMSGHGTGWVPKEYLSDKWSVASVQGGAQGNVQGGVDWEAMVTSPIPTRYMGAKDDGYLDIKDFNAALMLSETHFGYILFDACFMSSIEAIYDLRESCDYVIASPCEIMADGFPYDTVIPRLFANKGMEVDLPGVSQAFYNYYSTWRIESGCVAVAVTSELEALAEITSRINRRDAAFEELVEVEYLQPYERLKDHIFFDLEHYMLTKCSSYMLAQEFIEQMELTFPLDCRYHTDSFFANIGPTASSSNNYAAYYTPVKYYSGVTTSAPSVQLNDEWAATSWAAAVSL